jgi:hypothetical protein
MFLLGFAQDRYIAIARLPRQKKSILTSSPN